MENNIRQPAEPGNGPAAPLQSPHTGNRGAGQGIPPTALQTALCCHLPEELRQLKQWAVNAGPKAATPDDKQGKRPQVWNGYALHNASVTNPSQWMEFGTAANIAGTYGLNLGFLLTEHDPYVVIDLDIVDAETQQAKGQAINPEKWTTKDEYETFWNIAKAMNSYTERSRSGKGLHIFIRGKLPQKGLRKGNIEIYEAERFIICTGSVVIDEGIHYRQDVLELVLADMQYDPNALATLVELEPIEDDQTVINRAMSAENAEKFISLANGEYDDPRWNYPSRSEADLGLIGILAFYTQSNAQVRRIFRMTKLGQRDKHKKDYHINRCLKNTRGRQAAEAALRAKVDVDMPAIIAAAIARSNAVPVPGDRELISRSLDTVQMRAIDWVWTGWIPQGYITIVAGESGAGKTTITADIVARLTTGAPWPGETEWRMPARVLWLGSEDGMADMTVPRLTACHADRGKVIEIQGVSHGGKRGTFSMQDDIFAVSTMLDAQKRAGNPVAMLVIDPVTSYLPGQKLRKVDLNDAGQLRSILEPWSDLAQKHNLAIVCVTHFAKDTTRSMLHRVLGSAAFVQTCRSLCAVVNREGDDEPPHAKALIQVKTNLAEHPGGAWRFRTTKVEVGTDQRNGKIISATKPDWEELDENLTPTSLMGGTRGPVSHFPQVFGSWVHGYFKRAGAEWIGTDELKAAAIDAKVATQRWWNDHSSEFVEKENRGGRWMNRLRP